MKWYIKYGWFIILFSFLILVYLILMYIIRISEEYHPFIDTITVVLLLIPVWLFQSAFRQPVLAIRGIEERTFEIGSSPELENRWNYKAFRILVENIGRSAAKNCKAWIVTEQAKERVCWTTPVERPNATINPQDHEAVDFCAYYMEGPGTCDWSIARQYSGISVDEDVPKIIASTEQGWPSNHPWAARYMTSLIGRECQILITSENADSIQTNVKILRDRIEI